jgi:hypothetical protein
VGIEFIGIEHHIAKVMPKWLLTDEVIDRA